MDRRTRAGRGWSVLVAAAVGLGLVAVVSVSILVLTPGTASAQNPSDGGVSPQNGVLQAHLAVQFSDGHVVVRPITFTGVLSGVRALAMTDLEVRYEGDAICSIEGEGCPDPADPCFCPDNLWAHSFWDGSAWQQPWPFPNLSDGDVEGFAIGLPWPALPPPAPQLVAASNGLEYLRPLQDAATGGYGTANDTLETLLAVVANDYNARNWRTGLDAPPLLAAALAAGRLSQRADGAGKLATAMVAGDGCDLRTAKQITAFYDSTTGQYDPNPGYQAWAIIGLRALSQTVPAKAVQALEAMQKPDGGWPYGNWSTTSDTNGTALAVQALIAAGQGPGTPAVADGLNYLSTAQNADGGFCWNPAGTAAEKLSDANSTAYVLQAVLAAGEDPTAGRWVMGANTPVSFLLGMQLSNGAFEWQAGEGANQSATRQAIPGLLGRPFPWAAADLAACEAVFMPVTAK